MKIILIGVQGSGKGTQADLLKEHYDIPHISTGDIFRESLSKGTLTGIQAHAYWGKGTLVPDTIVNELINERLQEQDCETGFIFDGYPRTLQQALYLETITPINMVINLELTETTAIKRLSTREQCTACKKIYGEKTPPRQRGTCDECGGKLVKRPDDTPEAVKKRLEEYREKTKPLLNYYQEKGILYTVDANKSVEAIHHEILSILS